MTKITQIDDRSATTAWCPIQSSADVIALGTKDSGGGGFDDTGGELELYNLNVAQPKKGPKLIGSVKCTSRFASLGWASATDKIGNGRYEMGLIAGGMENGSVHVWNPRGVIAQQPSIVASYSQHSSGPVKALKFSTLDPTKLATGGSDGKVLIADLERLDKPVISAPSPDYSQSAQITSLAWNTQVAHIMASSSGDGTVAVWDLKARKAWCEIRETTGQAISDVVWNPTQGLHLVTAIADDRNPVLKLWDLRASTSLPLATLTGHQQGILSIAWCPHDDHLLLSCGKDNRTILWDLFTLKPIADLPNEVPTPQETGNSSTTELFGAGGLASSQQRRYDVQWSPIKRGVVSTCALDRKVQAHSILGLAGQCGRPPKWLRPSSSVSCGFGGAVVSCGSVDRIVRCQTVVEQPALVKVSEKFERELAATSIIDFCHAEAAKATDPRDSEMWGFMQVIFEANARQELLSYLGFNPEAIAAVAAAHKDATAANGVANMSLEDKQAAAGMSEAAEEVVKNAVLVGNFEAAVECCFENGNLADALVLASCGGADLWAQTQTRYFERECSKRPFLSIASAVIHSQLGELIEHSDLKNWKETLAILSTYSKSEDFPTLCVALGNLLRQSGDARSASLCFMCALSLNEAVAFWRQQLEDADKKKGSRDLLALHKFVIKVSVFLQAVGSSATLSTEDAELFAYYSGRLSEQGLLETAAKYSLGESAPGKILKDRLYRSRASPQCLAAMGGTPPDFPFTMADIKVSRQPTTTKTKRSEQQQVQQVQHAEQTRSTQTHTSNHQASSQSVQPVHQPTATSNALPAGWGAFQDPTTGNTYYANQTTGETTWEMPQAPQAHMSHSTTQAADTNAYQQQAQPTTNQQNTVATNGSTTNTLASKYGDGFVSSASHPELASQYGNVGTSNPYTNTDRPGTARVAAGVQKAPVSGTLDPDRIGEITDEFAPIQDVLLSLVDALKQTQLAAGDRRQLSEAEKGVAVFLKRLSRGDIPSDVGGKMLTMTTAIQAYDWRSALSIQTGLVNTDWKEHKDWLKGIKALLQLSSKKFST